MALNGREDRREEEEARAPLRLCSWPAHLEADCILSVGETEVHVNKTYLSKRSRFFHCLFNGDFVERRDDRYEIRGVDAESFIEMLRVVLPSRKPIDENNVESLLHLADRFMMDRLTKKCVKFLCSRSRAARSISCVVLVQLAFQYRLETLKFKARSDIYSMDNINSLRECPRFTELEREELEFICNIALRHNAAKWEVDMDCDCPTCVLAGVAPPPGSRPKDGRNRAANRRERAAFPPWTSTPGNPGSGVRYGSLLGNAPMTYRRLRARNLIRQLHSSSPVTYRNSGTLQYPPAAGCGSCDYSQARNSNPFMTYPNPTVVPYLPYLVPMIPVVVPIFIAIPLVPVVVTWYYQ